MVLANNSTSSGGRGITRRVLVRGVAGVGAASLSMGVAGCTGGGGGGPDQEIYVVAFHWGFRMITPDGSVSESIDMSQGDTLKLYAVNLEPIAEGEDIDIPDAVMSAAESGYEDWEHATLEDIAPKLNMEESALEEELEKAEEQFKDHGLGVNDPGGTQMLNLDLPGDMSSPVEETITLDATGSYNMICTVYCGVGHPYMKLEGAVSVA